jgi:translation initiation factor 1 (eIF-1/SUI1)
MVSTVQGIKESKMLLKQLNAELKEIQAYADIINSKITN